MQRSDREVEELYFKYEKYVPVTLKRGFPDYKAFAKTHGVDVDDLLQLGKIGLYKACQHYNPNKNASFSTYAIKKIKYTIMTEAKKYSLNNKTNRTFELADKTSMEFPLATTEGDVVDLHDVIESKNDAFDETELNMLLDTIGEVVSENVVKALKMRYDKFTFGEIGKELNMSPQAVQKMLKKNREVLVDYLLA